MKDLEIASRGTRPGAPEDLFGTRNPVLLLKKELTIPFLMIQTYKLKSVP